MSQDNLFNLDDLNLSINKEDNLFSKEKTENSKVEDAGWKILIVDDDEDIHQITHFALSDFEYKNRKIQFLDTYSGKETKKIINKNPDIALILLDVVMENDHSGLDVVKHIRDDLHNKLIRIVLRTGQAGKAPEKEVIMSYEINDYKTKTELTVTRLFAVILSALRTYDALMEIENHNQNLEKIVKIRTKEITDSIHYASRIQKAIISVPEKIKTFFTWYFLFNQPKDIVSGDFFWFSHRDNKLFFAIADCTGHGVPGAFMSILGNNLLNEIVRNNKYIPANEILNELRNHIIDSLHQKGVIGEQKDGMDIALCIYNKDTSILQYAGANNSLYLITNDELQITSERIIQFDNSKFKTQNSKLLYEVKPDKMPIGIYNNMKSFTNHEIKLNQTDYIYLFSDGFADQFGGQKGKKFKYNPFKHLLLKNIEKPMTEQKAIFENTFMEWKGDNEQTDDIMILGLKL